jgi:hypothetical protein
MSEHKLSMSKFGLASTKSEGAEVLFDAGVDSLTNSKPSNTRWIELCYDPDDPVDRAKYEEAEALISGLGLDDDQLYVMITALANRFVNDSGY